ncbi:MAG: methylmalonyl-CoA mutase family protein [Kofleriaceae bacterium]
MKPSPATLADWRAQVDKELAGVPFEKALVHATAEGIAIQPLYIESSIDPGAPGVAPFVRGASASPGPFQICMRVDARPESLDEDVAGGADALWLDVGDDRALEAAVAHRLGAIIEVGARGAAEAQAWLEGRASRELRGVLAIDPLSAVARGAASPATLDRALAELARVAASTIDSLPGVRTARVSSVVFHAAGADAADELALALSTGVAYLRALTDGGLDVAAAARALAVQVAIGRDTFGELCKLRALRLCWHKLLAAAGAPDEPLHALHAVCSPRTQSQRDPWVNMLRVTTEVFAAALGGAELVTPLSFDEALGAPSPLGRRTARNAALVLREESSLGRVLDPAGGAYYLEARTDALAREAWSRFTALERDGGIARALASGSLRERLAAAWERRAGAIARRKEPVLGVSEFANVDEQLPMPVPAPQPAPAAPALVPRRDAEPFEALRARVEAAPREVALVTLGPPSEHRARLGYASALFAAAGLRATETAAVVRADIACLCGSDERYAELAAARARELRAAGCRRVVLAGRPGPLEAELRAAGVDHFVFVGCDVVATLTQLLEEDA